MSAKAAVALALLENSASLRAGGRTKAHEANAKTQEDLPVYRKIAAILDDSIKAGRLMPGTILMEGSLAAIFGSSWTPVKQALSDLSERGVIQRFDGRGFVVGAAKEPRRVPVTAGLLGLDEANPELPRTWAWQRIYDGVERALIFHSALGKFRVNEVELARHYKVGSHRCPRRSGPGAVQRTLAKDERLRWYVVPLDEKRVCDLYDLRELLEPKAIAAGVGRVPPDFLTGMAERLEAAISAYPKVSAAEMDALEHGLHVTSLGYCGNRRDHGGAQAHPLSAFHSEAHARRPGFLSHRRAFHCMSIWTSSAPCSGMIQPGQIPDAGPSQDRPSKGDRPAGGVPPQLHRLRPAVYWVDARDRPRAQLVGVIGRRNCMNIACENRSC